VLPWCSGENGAICTPNHPVGDKAGIAGPKPNLPASPEGDVTWPFNL